MYIKYKIFKHFVDNIFKQARAHFLVHSKTVSSIAM